MGIEPTSEAWEAPILPLNYARSLSILLIIHNLANASFCNLAHPLTQPYVPRLTDKSVDFIRGPS